MTCITLLAAGCSSGPTDVGKWVARQGGTIADARVGRAQRLADRLLSNRPCVPVVLAVLARPDLCAYSWPDGKVNWELEVYSGAQHGFTNPTNASEERADREYKVAIQRFFKEIFGS